jgi:hypothetical protein
MFFKFITYDGTEYDLTDYVDELAISTEREQAIAPAGLLNASRQVGESIVSGFNFTTRGILFASDYATLRTILKKMLERKYGFVQIETDRKMPAQFAGSSPDLTEWVGGVPVMRLSLRFATAGYAQDLSYSYGSAVAGGWSVNNSGDLPCPMRVQLQFQNAQTNQSVLIQGGKAPDGTTPVNIEWKGNVAANDILVIDSGVDGLRVTLNGNDDADGITSGYPPWLATGSSSITYSLVPSNVIVSSELRFYRRWQFL